MHLNSKKFQGTVPGSLNAIKVNNGDISTAIRLWKKQQKDSNIVQELFDKKYYKKKSVVRREQLSAAKYNQKKEAEGVI